MNVRIVPHKFCGTVTIPASKSHTIRQLLTASLADGISEIKHPLDSLDTQSCITACKVFGAQITEHFDGSELVGLTVHGNNGFKSVSLCEPFGEQLLTDIDVGNSGTTLYLALAVAALQSQPVRFTGDEQIKKRSAMPLLDALTSLGIKCESNNGCAPITVSGTWKGGKAILPCPTSQYLSALLIASPLAPAGTVTKIEVPLLNEKPYIEMTLSYLKAHGILYSSKPDFSYFEIPGGASYKAFSRAVPADFSSAAFPAAAAVISGGEAQICGLDPNDTQGDKYFFEILEKMGCNVKSKSNGNNKDSEYTVTVSRSRDGGLTGGTFDLNETPDLLPAAAVTAAFAHGDTALVNVANARIKETDRIAVMAKELKKLGVSCTELPDGLIVHGKGGLFAGGEAPPTNNIPVIDGSGDHRIVMAFAAAALGSSIPIEITTAESASVTYPGFLDLLKAQL